VFYPAFSKAGEMFPKGNVSAALPLGNAAKRHDCCGSNKDIRRRRQKGTRSVLPRQGQTSCLSGSF